jgi:hypothetical protein
MDNMDEKKYTKKLLAQNSSVDYASYSSNFD